jgi:rod shape determining protein RodA
MREGFLSPQGKAVANLKTTRFTLFDTTLLLVVFAIGLIGILTLYSTTQGGSEDRGVPVYQKQAIWLALGILAMLTVILVDHRHMDHYAYAIYLVSILFLLYVLLFGRSIAGAKRWIELGPIRFQPSEFIKITMTLALAKYFQNNPREGKYSLSQLRIPFLLFVIPFCLVLLEPDLGTAIILLLIFLSICLFLGLTTPSIYVLLFVGIASLPMGWLSLKEYQKDRVLTFLDPSRDPLGSGYHIIQSKIAIGSGGVLGKGFLHGTQTRLHFLPEQHTDFIFSAFAEQWGFVGGALLLAGYLLVIFWAFNICSRAKNRFGMILGLGITFLLFWHVAINLGMCLALLPVVGIPLPFFSYGGSFLLVMFTAIGLLLNIYIRRFIF